MDSIVIYNISDYISAIKELTNDQSLIAEKQRFQLLSLKENNLDNNFSDYYCEVFEMKKNILETIQKSRYHKSCNNGSNSQQYKFYYRGHYSSKFELIPSVFRGTNWYHEDYYYHEITVHCPQYFQYDSHLDKLVTMQHYNCPTRLLDVTTNPLVALYFACKNYGCDRCDRSSEGEVLLFPVLSSDVVYSDSDRALLLSCLPRFNSSDKRELLKEIYNSLSLGKFRQVKGGSRYASTVVERFYHEITTELPSFKRELKPFDLLHPLFVQPNKTNNRILKQDGAFIINGLSANKNEAQHKLKNLTHASIKICNQEIILNELKSLGISEASLFPEVDKVAQYLKESIQ